MDILVINTDPVDRTIIQQVLEHGEHKISFVDNTDAAWKLIAEEGFRFVIADAVAQPQSVYQLIQQTRKHAQRFGQVYFLILARKGHNESLTAGLEAGADDYLTIPLIPQELKIRVSVGERILFMGTTLTQAREQLDNLAMYDNLTGLMKRQAFYQVAQGELERARRGAQGISVIALFLKNLEAIIQQHGQAVGNDVLLIIAQIIREKSRPYDCIGHWDNAQYVITLSGILSTDAEKITHRILTGVHSSQISLTDGPALELELIAGIASTQTIKANTEIETLIQSAIQAMRSSEQNDSKQVSVTFL